MPGNSAITSFLLSINNRLNWLNKYHSRERACARAHCEFAHKYKSFGCCGSFLFLPLDLPLSAHTLQSVFSRSVCCPKTNASQRKKKKRKICLWSRDLNEGRATLCGRSTNHVTISHIYVRFCHCRCAVPAEAWTAPARSYVTHKSQYTYGRRFERIAEFDHYSFIHFSTILYAVNH